MDNDKFYVVVGPNNNSACEGRLFSLDEAIERCEYWSKVYPGQRYFVCEAVYEVQLPQEPIVIGL